MIATTIISSIKVKPADPFNERPGTRDALPMDSNSRSSSTRQLNPLGSTYSVKQTVYHYKMRMKRQENQGLMNSTSLLPKTERRFLSHHEQKIVRIPNTAFHSAMWNFEDIDTVTREQ